MLPFLERMLEANFAAAGAAAAGGNREAAQQHVLVIQAALQAVNTYSGGWAREGGGGWLAGSACRSAALARGLLVPRLGAAYI